jgi:hypothetical protein
LLTLNLSANLKHNLSGLFLWDLSVVRISRECVTSPEQGKSSGRIATFSIWIGASVMAFPPFLVEQLQRCDLVDSAQFVGTGYTTGREGWLLGWRGYSITHHYPLL